jgi:hypothetical protein
MSIRCRFEWLALAAVLAFASGARADEDPLAEFRERFKMGMERYKSGAIAEAIAFWEPIYRDLGTTRGYRLAYNLSVAYEEFGDATHGAEKLESFLAEVASRRARGDAVEPIVAKEETDARARLAALVASKGRIKVGAGQKPVAVQVDAGEPRIAGFVAYVSPGEHTVTFEPGTPRAEKKDVTARAGEIVDVAPQPPPPPAPAPPPPPASALAPRPQWVAPPLRTVKRTEPPFSPVVLYAGGGVTVATTIAAILLRSHTYTLRDRYDGTSDPNQVAEFNTSRTFSYATLGGAIGFGVATGALATWYFLGKSEREKLVPVPVVAPEKNGASLGVRVGF